MESKLAEKKIASKQDRKIAKLKQELAAAEAAKSGSSDDSDPDSSKDSSADSSSDSSSAKSDSAGLDLSKSQSLVTAKDFKKLPEPVAKVTDSHIAKEAGIFFIRVLIIRG